MIVCGHFADGAEKFTSDAVQNETKAEWNLRQKLGTANFDSGPVLAFMSRHLSYQIEHHLFPDLSSNRYPKIARRVEPLLAKYDLPYTTGPLARQFWDTVRTICKLSLPDAHIVGTVRRGLVTAIAERRLSNPIPRQRFRPGTRPG